MILFSFFFSFCDLLGRHGHSNGTAPGGSSAGVVGPTGSAPPLNNWPNNLPMENRKSKFSSLTRLFKPWKWRVRRKSDKLESVSQCKNRRSFVFGT